VQIKAELAGNLWKIVVREGQEVQADETLMILESMKMEIPVNAPGATRDEDPRARGPDGPGRSAADRGRLGGATRRLARLEEGDAHHGHAALADRAEVTVTLFRVSQRRCSRRAQWLQTRSNIHVSHPAATVSPLGSCRGTDRPRRRKEM